MNNTQVLFIGQLDGDTQAWAYGLGKHGIYSVTATIEDVATATCAVESCALMVVDMVENHQAVVAFCDYVRTIFQGPLLVFTYEHDERFHLRLYQSGIDECVIKPIGTPLALAKIMSWLRAEFPKTWVDSIGQQSLEH